MKSQLTNLSTVLDAAAAKGQGWPIARAVRRIYWTGCS